jgi:hypothetical protein
MRIIQQNFFGNLFQKTKNQSVQSDTSNRNTGDAKPIVNTKKPTPAETGELQGINRLRKFPFSDFLMAEWSGNRKQKSQ